MSRGGLDPQPEALPAPPPPRPEVACGKCGTILAGAKETYWHDRRDSAGCIRSLMGMVLNLNERLSVIEAALTKAAAASTETPAPEPTA